MPPLPFLFLLACGADLPAQEPTSPPTAPPAADTPAPPGLEELDPGRFHTLEPGLELGHFPSSTASILGDERVTVLRIDPAHWSVEVLAASKEHPGRNPTGPGWAREHGLVATINAGMFAMDHRTATFALVDEGHENNARFGDNANSLLLAEPSDDASPSARLLDMHCDDHGALRPSYGSLVQSYRLLSCGGHPAWKPSAKIWSHALVGADGEGRILFVHARSPWSTHAFTEILLELPLDIRRLHYAEGGPEATLHLRHGARSLTLVGSYETGFNENDDNRHAWPIPNVIAVRAR